MPFMTKARTLRSLPNGAKTEDVLEEGLEVTLVEEREGWARVRRVGTQVDGWVLRDAVGDSGPTDEPTMERAVFFRQCWRDGLRMDIVPHYLAAVAHLRSGITAGIKDNLQLPFGFSAAEWDIARKDAALGFIDYGSVDIREWDMQLAMFAAMAHRDLKVLEEGTVDPSPAKLYLAQLVGPTAATSSINSPLDTIKSVIDRTADDEIPQGLSRAEILTRYAALLGADGANSGTNALNAIVAAMQPAIDTVKDEVVAAGTEVLAIPENFIPIIADPSAPTPEPRPPGNIPDSPDGDVPDVPGAGGLLGQLISRGEGGYGSFNRGFAGDSAGERKNFAAMTIRDIRALQSLPKGHPEKLLAVGKYQVVPGTMRGAIEALGIADNETYGPELQEKIFRLYLVGAKRPQVKRYITGVNNNLTAAQLALAQEFASVANPHTGRSHYAGIGGNRASISAGRAAAALNAERQRYQQLIAQGQSPDAAWFGLSA